MSAWLNYWLDTRGLDQAPAARVQRTAFPAQLKQFIVAAASNGFLGRIMRFSYLLLLIPLVGVVAPGAATSHAEPNDYFQGKTITIYVDNPVGGGYDLNARVLARHLGDHIPGHPGVIVSNMPGAHGIRGANFIYTVAPKDGTALGAEIADLAEYQVEGIEGMSYDASRFGWIGSIAPTNIVLYVWHTVPVRTIADLKSRETVLASFGPVPTYARLLEELALQLRFISSSESMSHRDSEDHGWVAHQLRRRWSFGRRRCGI
ncbi:MAG: hypothetical protein WBF07_03245, partial [Xanthobacteraceae bacterium]